MAARLKGNGNSRQPKARQLPTPNRGKLKRKDYASRLRKLQVELCRLQEWVKYKGLRVITLFEGRNAAGKGGTIKALTERVSPRVFRTAALPVPPDRAALHGVTLN